MKWTYQYETVDVFDDHVAVPVGDSGNFHRLIGMNDTGLCLFRLLGQGLTEEEIIERMREEYDELPETLAEEVRLGIEALMEIGAVTP